jgi:hypothetical protein
MFLLRKKKTADSLGRRMNKPKTADGHDARPMCGKGAHIRRTLDLWFDSEGSVQFSDHVDKTPLL